MADRSEAVLDASALVDLLAGTDREPEVRARLGGTGLHAPAHVDVETLSALGRLCRAEALDVAAVDTAVRQLAAMPLSRHPLPALLAGAWARRGQHRLTDALYVELAVQLHVPLLTTDGRLARVCLQAEAVGG